MKPQYRPFHDLQPDPFRWATLLRKAWQGTAWGFATEHALTRSFTAYLRMICKGNTGEVLGFAKRLRIPPCTARRMKGTALGQAVQQQRERLFQEALQRLEALEQIKP